MSWLYKIALGIDCTGVIIAVYFIISDSIRSISSNNGMLSAVTLGMCAWIGISYYFHTNCHTRIATAMAWVPAFPLLAYGLLVLIMVIGKPDFK